MKNLIKVSIIWVVLLLFLGCSSFLQTEHKKKISLNHKFYGVYIECEKDTKKCEEFIDFLKEQSEVDLQVARDLLVIEMQNQLLRKTF